MRSSVQKPCKNTSNYVGRMVNHYRYGPTVTKYLLILYSQYFLLLFKIADALSLWLPDSKFYALLSTLPPPDPTNPTATTVFEAQTAIQNSLPILESITSIIEKEEGNYMAREVDQRRKRINAGGPEQVKREVGMEIWSSSKV